MKKIGLRCSCFWTPIGPMGLPREHTHVIRQHQLHSEHRQEWHSQQSSCTATEKCGAGEA